MKLGGHLIVGGYQLLVLLLQLRQLLSGGGHLLHEGRLARRVLDRQDRARGAHRNELDGGERQDQKKTTHVTILSHQSRAS